MISVLMRCGMPNTVAVLALAMMPLVALTAGIGRRADAAAVQQAETLAPYEALAACEAPAACADLAAAADAEPIFQ